MTSLQRLQEIRAQAAKDLAKADSVTAVGKVRAHFLGRDAELLRFLGELPELPVEERRAMGRAANELRRELERSTTEREQRVADDELDRSLAGGRVDLTLPGVPTPTPGSLHLLTQTQRDIEDVLVGLGFTILEGPEVETVENNFDALNHDRTHPARERSDTFYITDATLLRTHTSPMQIRAMRQQPPPLYVAIPGRVYRRDSDATHTQQFHQVEGLAIAEDITLADLKGTLIELARQVLGPDLKIRVRGHFFPFTEPSIEIDVSCQLCTDGLTADASRCHICKGETWLEILGAGVVDPNVLSGLEDPAYDPERVQGFAWGIGLERVALLKHGLPNIRINFENDLRFLEQYT